MQNIEWVFELKKEVPVFLKKLKSDKVPGFFRYSLSGDLYNEKFRWGLGNTVFTAKVYYSLGLLEGLSNDQKTEMINFIKSFENKDGSIYDSLVIKKAFLRDKLFAIKDWDFNNFFHRQTIRAETRQSIAALMLLGKEKFSYENFPKTKEGVDIYLSRLNWKVPWGAGSHFAHLLFFINNSKLNNKKELIEYVINWVNELQHSEDGCWYRGDPKIRQKINGAMKVLMGLRTVGNTYFNFPERLVDLCLLADKGEHGCDNFNVVYVLYNCNLLLNGGYRFDEIREAVLKRLSVYKQYYFSEFGGFSMLPGRANSYYYNAKITKGFREPDIHGTCLFLWGISIISKIMDFDKELGFYEQIP